MTSATSSEAGTMLPVTATHPSAEIADAWETGGKIADRPMRVLMLIDLYPPFLGGAQQHVQTLGRTLAARGHDVAVATLWHEGLPEFEVIEGLRIYRIRGSLHRMGVLFQDPGQRYAPPFPDPELVRALHRVVARERPDIVHAHSWLVDSFLPLKAWSGAKLVVSLHDYNLRCAKWTLMRNDALCSGPGVAKCLSCAANHYGAVKGVVITLGNWAMRLPQRATVDMYLPVSNAVAEGNGLIGGGLPYQVIPNFVPDESDDETAEIAAYIAQLPREEFILYVGSLTHRKGVTVLLDAHAGLRDAPPLVLVGYTLPDSPTTFPVGVTVLKNWPHAAVMAAWRRSMLGVVPSIWPEPCPTVAMEAMVTGRPVVASRIGGLPDLVADGETGILTAPGDVDALRLALDRLVRDPAERERMGMAARQRARAFQAQSVIERIERAYGEVAHG
jgi:glycosyltransferase involved in cell wall biosynthesis